MLTISMSFDNLFFKDIAKENLEEVLHLYNQNEINMYATGIDRPMSFEDISQKYLEVLVNSHEFFAGIFSTSVDKQAEKMIGVVKGRIDYDNSDEAWISSILIDSGFQKSGYGTKAVGAVLNLLRDTYDIKTTMIGILSGNSIGKDFWGKMGFNYIRTINQYIRLNNKDEDFIIMKKDL